MQVGDLSKPCNAPSRGGINMAINSGQNILPAFACNTQGQSIHFLQTKSLYQEVTEYTPLPPIYDFFKPDFKDIISLDAVCKIS